MRKTIVLLILSAVLVFSLGAQNFNYISLANDFSAGLFPSALDQAITVFDDGYGPGFGELPHSYLLGGITNLGDDQAGSTVATTFTNADPIFFGVYRQGDMPWSFVTGLEFTTITGEDDSNTDEVFGGAVTVGTEDHPLLTSKTVTEYEPRSYADFDAQAQFLTVLSGIKTGLYLNLDVTDNAVGTNNFTEDVITYYNAAGAGIIPDATEDYRITTTETDMGGTVTDLVLAVPFAMEGGEMIHSGNLRYNLNVVDSSVSAKDILKLGSQNLNGVTNTNNTDSTTEKAATHDIGLLYRMTRASLLSSHEESFFTAWASFDLTFTGGTYSDSAVSEDYTTTGGGAAMTTANLVKDTTEATIDATLGFDISLGASEKIYHDFNDMVSFGLEPGISAGFTRSYTTGALTKSVNVVKTDGDDDGLFTSAADTIDTTTITYTGTNTALGDLTYTDTLSVNFSLPAALKFQPEGWVCGFVLSSEPALSYSRDKNVTEASKTTTVTHSINGDGSGETTATTISSDAATITSSSTVDGNWSLTNTTSIGAEFYLPGDILLLVDINGNLWEPEGFTIQAVIPTDFLFEK